MYGEAALIIMAFLVFVLFWGKPDLHDALISRLQCNEVAAEINRQIKERGDDS
jgi:hypothetical protein